MENKKYKITLAPSIAIDALDPYVEEIEKAVNKVRKVRHRRILTTDESVMAFYFTPEPTGTKFDERLQKEIQTATYNTDQNQKLIKEVEEILGVSIDLYDRVYEVAIRLRDKE